MQPKVTKSMENLRKRMIPVMKQELERMNKKRILVYLSPVTINQRVSLTRSHVRRLKGVRGKISDIFYDNISSFRQGFLARSAKNYKLANAFFFRTSESKFKLLRHFYGV